MYICTYVCIKHNPKASDESLGKYKVCTQKKIKNVGCWNKINCTAETFSATRSVFKQRPEKMRLNISVEEPLQIEESEKHVAFLGNNLYYT